LLQTFLSFMTQAAQAQVGQREVLESDVGVPEQVRLVICGPDEVKSHGSRRQELAHLAGGASAHAHQYEPQPGLHTADVGRRRTGAAPYRICGRLSL